MSQRLRKEGNVRINTMSAMRPGLAKIIMKVRISRHFTRPETDLHRAENACCIDYADTRWSKRVHCQSKRKSTDHSTTYYGCENIVEYDTGVAWEILPSKRIHTWVSQDSNIPWLPATIHHTGKNGPSSRTSWKFEGQSNTGPSGCRKGISLLCIQLSLCPMTCSRIWTALCEL